MTWRFPGRLSLAFDAPSSNLETDEPAADAIQRAVECRARSPKAGRQLGHSPLQPNGPASVVDAVEPVVAKYRGLVKRC